MTDKKAPLAGIRVADFSWLIAAPFGTLMLALMGAEVIKVESRARPDEVRLTVPFKDGKPGLDRAIFYLQSNAGKRSFTLDLSKPKGRDLAKQLVATSDLAIENFRPGQMERWGLGYEDLKAVKPDIVMVRASMHGQTGPYARQPLLGTFFQGAIGFHNLVGWPDRAPSGIPSAYTDYIAPWFVAMGALAGLEHRRKTGHGTVIDVSQVEASPHFLAPKILDFFANGRVAERHGNLSDYASPNGAYRCAGDDRWVAISICTDEQWRSLCTILGQPALAGDARYHTREARRARSNELDRVIGDWTKDRIAEDVVRVLQGAGVPAGVVNSGEDLMERDEQLKARQVFRTVHHAEVGDYRAVDVPFRFSKAGSDVRAAHLLGEDSEYVCCQLLGLSDQEFAKLVEEGVIN